MTRRREETELLGALEGAFGTFRKGNVHRGTYDIDGLTVHVEVSIRGERLDPATAAEIRREILDHIAGAETPAPSILYVHARNGRCQVYTKSRGFLKGGGGQCDRTASGAIVYQGYRGERRYILACGQHREHNGVDPSAMVGVVEIPVSAIAEAKRRRQLAERSVGAQS